MLRNRLPTLPSRRCSSNLATVRVDAYPQHRSGWTTSSVRWPGEVHRLVRRQVRSTIETLREDHPVDVVAFGACSCAGGPYWDSAAVVDGLPAIGVEADHWIPGCPPAPDALTGFLSSSREAA